MTNRTGMPVTWMVHEQQRMNPQVLCLLARFALRSEEWVVLLALWPLLTELLQLELEEKLELEETRRDASAALPRSLLSDSRVRVIAGGARGFGATVRVLLKGSGSEMRLWFACPLCRRCYQSKSTKGLIEGMRVSISQKGHRYNGKVGVLATLREPMGQCTVRLDDGRVVVVASDSWLSAESTRLCHHFNGVRTLWLHEAVPQKPHARLRSPLRQHRKPRLRKESSLVAGGPCQQSQHGHVQHDSWSSFTSFWGHGRSATSASTGAAFRVPVGNLNDSDEDEIDRRGHAVDLMACLPRAEI